VIAVPHDLPAAPAERADDRNNAAGPSRAQATLRRRAQPETPSPGDAALVSLAQLLGRLAAQEHVKSPGEMT
jgi:hypothetical protein